MYIINFMGFFAAISDMGFSTIGIRDMSKLENKETYWHKLLSIKFAFLPISFLGFPLILLLNPNTPKIITLSLISLFYSLFSISAEFIRIRYRVEEKMHFETISKITGAVILFLGVYLSSVHSLRISLLFANYAISSFVAFIFAVLLLRKLKSRIYFLWDTVFIKGKLKQALPVLGAFVFFYVFTKTDGIIIYNVLGEKPAGIYQVCANLVFIIVMITGVIFNASFPLMSQKINDNNLSFIGIYGSLITFAVGIIIYLGIYFFADILVTSIYGLKYKESVSVLKYYGLILPSFLGLNFFNYYFVAIGYQRYSMYTYGIACILLPVTFISTKLWGLYGAAISISIIGFVAFLIGLMLALSIKKLNN